jgi:hypothetical protein
MKNATQLYEGTTTRFVSGEIAEPLFLLVIPRSFSSVTCAMIGQHPEMYGLPEMELFGAQTVGEWWELCARPSFPTRAHGTLRAVAQLIFGSQTAHTVEMAKGWLRRRSHFTTGFLLEILARKVHPRVIVEKSTTNVYDINFMERAYRMFPRSRFLHVVRHPRGQAESAMRFLKERQEAGPLPSSNWMIRLASFPPLRSAGANGTAKTTPDLDPQRAWYFLNLNICEFLKSVPDNQKKRIRGEDLLSHPDQSLREIASWMGLRIDAQAIEEMKHPERSPYASFGPPGARFGNDRLFLESPALRTDRAKPQSLDGPLSWRLDGEVFSPEVIRLAREFGYA